MPAGKTHDSITFLLAVPVWFVVWKFTRGWEPASLAAIAFVFGGLMFGPDLDTQSIQYGRWGVFKILWLPYRYFFKHRSFWTHGLLFGAILRTAYFVGMLTIIVLGAVILTTGLFDLQMPGQSSVWGTWRRIGELLRGVFGPFVFYEIFAGLWLGAASHSLVDTALSYLKTGR